MKTPDVSTGRIEKIVRLAHSHNGNPRFQITWNDHATGNTRTAITQSDAAYGYEVENPGHSVGDVVAFTLTPAGRIAYGASTSAVII